MFDALDGRQLLVLLIFLLLSAAVIFLLMADGALSAIIFGAVLLVALWITRSVWSPDDTPTTKVATASLTAIGAVAAGYFKLSASTRQAVAAHTGASWGGDGSAVDWGVGVVLACVLVSIVAVNYLARAMPAAGRRVTPSHPSLREKSFSEQLRGFCKTMAAELNKIDTETNWSANWFVPVEAEVEVVSNNRRTRRLRDMLTAIRGNRRDQLFVVVGDPGAGKSVALRVLCEQLIPEVTAKKGKVPLYINLKEWSSKQQWTREQPPTVSELCDFIVHNLKRRLDAFGSEFLDHYFDRMLDNGLFFFVFDSFDEIPALLDVDESSWLVGALSSVFDLFFFGRTDSRGILASREFRRPRITRGEGLCTLQVRPFSEIRIEASFRRSLVRPENIKRLFGERRDLVPLARNPFTAGLIIDYLRQPPHLLPVDQAEIYESCVRRRLLLVQDRLLEAEMTVDNVIALATAVAGLMFESTDVGLEIGVQAIQSALDDPCLTTSTDKFAHAQRIATALDLLVAARIGRKSGAGGLGRFSFVHRRFNEYFFVRYLLSKSRTPSLQSIPLDSKWRDALVLYAQLCNESEAKQIAQFCWQEMQATTLSAGDAQTYLRHVHSLRFLSDAFHGRTVALANFVDQLFDHIRKTLQRSPNLLIQRIAVESAGLLTPEQIEPLIREALSRNSILISEAAFNACRYIPRLSSSIETRLAYFLSNLSASEVFARYAEIRFALELSSAMRHLRQFWWWHRVDQIVAILAIVSFTVFNQLGALSAVILSEIFQSRFIVQLDIIGHDWRNLRGAWSLGRWRMSFFLGGLFSCVVCLNTQTEVVERFWLHVPNIAPLVVSPLCALLLALSVLPWYRFWYQRQRIREQLRRFFVNCGFEGTTACCNSRGFCLHSGRVSCYLFSKTDAMVQSAIGSTNA